MIGMKSRTIFMQYMPKKVTPGLESRNLKIVMAIQGMFSVQLCTVAKTSLKTEMTLSLEDDES